MSWIDSVRDTIAFGKTQKAQGLMIEALASVDPARLNELPIKLDLIGNPGLPQPSAHLPAHRLARYCAASPYSSSDPNGFAPLTSLQYTHGVSGVR